MPLIIPTPDLHPGEFFAGLIALAGGDGARVGTDTSTGALAARVDDDLYDAWLTANGHTPPEPAPDVPADPDPEPEPEPARKSRRGGK